MRVNPPGVGAAVRAKCLLLCGLVGSLLIPSSFVLAQSAGVDDRVASVGASGVMNDGRLLWSGGLRMKSKVAAGPYSVRVRVRNDELGFVQTLVFRGIVEGGVSFGGPTFVDGVERSCGPLKKKVEDGESVPLVVSVEVLEAGSTSFTGSLPELGRRVSSSKYVGGFATDPGKDDPADRGTTTLYFKRPQSSRDRFSVMIVDDPASGRRQASFLFSGSWPRSLSLRGDWRAQQKLFVQQLGSVESTCE